MLELSNLELSKALLTRHFNHEKCYLVAILSKRSEPFVILPTSSYSFKFIYSFPFLMKILTFKNRETFPYKKIP